MCRNGNDTVSTQCKDAVSAADTVNEWSPGRVYPHIAHALARGYTDLYYVNMDTDKFIEFNTDDELGVLSDARRGSDFFEGCVRDVKLYVHEEDRELFASTMNREFLAKALESDKVYEFTYRRIKNNRSFYVRMKVSRMEDDPRLVVIAVSDIDELMKKRRAEERIKEERLVYARLQALTGNFIVVYVVDPETDDYHEFSATVNYEENLGQAKEGSDFFNKVREESRYHNHPDDLERFLHDFTKENVMSAIEGSGTYTLGYRFMMNGSPLHVQMKAVMVEEKEGPRLIVGLNDIDAQVRSQLAIKADQMKRVTYTQIAERLADNYDLIYYIDCSSSFYAEFSTKKKSGEFKVQEEGDDFFAACRNNVDRLIYSEDRERIRLFLDRDHLMSQLESSRQLTQDYRMNTEDGGTQYTRMSVTYSSDHSHFIICVENRDADVRKEQEHLAALSTANAIARRDELTHTKNMTAYHEAETELREQMGEDGGRFGIVVCDINDLKAINDTQGHKAGDDYIRASCTMVCRIFQHSPVFRIGGDEFAVILKGHDYENREHLLSALRRKVEENIRIGEGPVVASGLAEYQPDEDHSVEDVFNRADSLMYENKTYLKEQKHHLESDSSGRSGGIRNITEERRNKLDALFKAISVVSEGTYAFLCDMKYDFSRWSKNAVDTFGLPSEYMYGAGAVWGERIHPEDRHAYIRGIDDIFSGNASQHDMQYRVKRVSGDYDVCTCRGIVVRDYTGEPDYFAGTVRNHGIQGHIDMLTGLGNQYAFFEYLDSCIKRNAQISVIIFGISKFSEINEMYGYDFGNRVLQRYARKVYETAGNTGHTYRIDGTKFAVISNTLSVAEMRANYNRFRTLMHENFRVDDRKIMIDLHCGALRIDHFDLDTQTVYACLNFAYEESKIRQRGEMVEFRHDLNEESYQRLEKLHAIRASIMHNYEGFYLLYQPVVDAQTEQLIGAEALLRWKDDRYGMVPPDQFIPILESDPLFPELGEWIIREAVSAAGQMLKRRPEFIINVNLSYTQLAKPDFADMVLRILEELDYPPEHLCFEVTERCRLLDLDLLKNVLASLRSRSIMVALDDFGTGFSSVGILKEIPVNIIKIDRSFVQMIEENDLDRKVVQSIADLASVFSAKVCAEGIETPGMRDILKQFNVESFQGYYYAKPLKLEQILEWGKASGGGA